MCGIAGFQGDFAVELLPAMAQAMAHRGPDGEGVACFDGPGARTGLAHRRLAIIDLSPEGRQPMGVDCARCGAHALSDLVLTYNGELYNFRELRQELEASGHTFHSRTDSEVLLHLYGEHGPTMLSRLNGIFAFAIREGRERGPLAAGDLFLARDGLGVKPLYHADVPGGFVFASEIKALLRSPAVAREVDPVALQQYLAYLWTPAPRTMLRDVHKLPPGHALVVRRGRVHREWRHYDLPYGRSPTREGGRALAAEVRARVHEAVRRQLVSDVPVGAFLSGGLDSSAVVAGMTRAGSDRPVCYTIAFAGGAGVEGAPDDLPYAEAAAARLGVELRRVHVGPEMIEHLDRLLWHLDEPQADPAPINALLIAERARADGIKVLLSGAGGDDLFSGYRRHRALALEGVWDVVPRQARAGLALGIRALSGMPALGGVRPTWARRAAKLLAHADLSRAERLAAHFWWSPEAVRRPLLAPAFAAEVADARVAEPLLRSLQTVEGESPLNRMLYLDARHFLADHNLNYTDKTGMASGVEVRVPLLDRDLVELATRIPASLKQRGATGKYILKKAMEPDLPRRVVYRPKSGFGAPLRRWLQCELRDRVEETLDAAALRRRGFFDPEAVRTLIRRDRAGQVDGAYTIFALMCFELWCRLFLDTAVPEQRVPAGDTRAVAS